MNLGSSAMIQHHHIINHHHRPIHRHQFTLFLSLWTVTGHLSHKTADHKDKALFLLRDKQELQYLDLRNVCCVKRPPYPVVLLGLPCTLPLQSFQASPYTSIMDEIHHAAIAGKLALVKSLVEDHPDLVDLEDIHARTPLMLTSSVQVAQYLLEQGTSIDQATPDGATALYYACRHGRNPDLVALLLSKGADPCMQNCFDSTPLMMCCSHGDEKEKRGQVVGHLLRYISPQHASSLDQKNRNGKTAMFMAAEQGLKDVIVRLMAAGADPRIEATAMEGGEGVAAAAAAGGGGGLDIDGQSAMSVKHVAQADGHDRIVYLIEEALADSERIRLLHKARHMMDVIHATERAIAEEVDNDEDGEGAMNDRGVKEAKQEKAHERSSTKGDEETKANRIRRKVLAAVPPYLKPRITQRLELPLVHVNPAAEEIGGGKSEGDEVEEKQAKDRMLLKDVGEFVLGGQLPPELFIELMVMMRQRWYI